MRSFVDSILASIGAASLNDDEFELIDQTSETYSRELYDEMSVVIASRGTIGQTQDRLKAYFFARGVVVDSPKAKTGILIGADLGN